MRVQFKAQGLVMCSGGILCCRSCVKVVFHVPVAVVMLVSPVAAYVDGVRGKVQLDSEREVR